MTDTVQRAGAGHATRRDRQFVVGLARAFGGAIFFSLPLLMTMEMWYLGFYMDRGRLALFMALMVPVFIVLDRFSGFEDTTTWAEDVLDGMVAYGVGFVASAAVLLALNVIGPSTAFREIVGKVSLQAVPAGFGAVLAASQLHSRGAEQEHEESRKRAAGYWTELFFMLVGAVFLAFNLAPTEEVVLLAYRMSPWHGVVMALGTLAMMHAFVYGVSFRGAPHRAEEASGWGLFLRFTTVGYAIALLTSAYVLWTFGRLEALPLAAVVHVSAVLAFPAGLGAAAARLIL